MEENRPAGGSDEPGNRDAAAMGGKFIAALAAAHGVEVSAAIELRAAFTEGQQGRISGIERENSRIGSYLQCLDFCTVLFDGEAQRTQTQRNAKPAEFDCSRLRDFTNSGGGRAPIRSHQGAVGRDRREFCIYYRQDAQTKRVVADGSKLNFDFFACDAKRALRLFGCLGDRKS